MATSPQPAAASDNDDNRAAATASGAASAADQNVTPHTDTEKESDDFLNRETFGQVTDDNNASGQRMADLMDDSLRSDMQAPTGSAPASDQNVPDELVRPSEAGYTLPEYQHQGRRLTAEGDDDK